MSATIIRKGKFLNNNYGLFIHGDYIVDSRKPLTPPQLRSRIRAKIAKRSRKINRRKT